MLLDAFMYPNLTRGDKVASKILNSVSFLFQHHDVMTVLTWPRFDFFEASGPVSTSSSFYEHHASGQVVDDRAENEKHSFAFLPNLIKVLLRWFVFAHTDTQDLVCRVKH